MDPSSEPDRDGEDAPECPNCGTPTLGAAYTVMVELVSGREAEGALCTACGVVYVPEPLAEYRKLHGLEDGGGGDDADA